MFGRKKETAEPAEVAEPIPTGKGRPTPKRKDSEARNKRPLVPTDRAAARRAQREKMARARAKMDEAMVTGNDQYLPAQHRGRARRFLRDYVDARWSIGEAFMPLAVLIVLILLLASFLPIPVVVATGAFYGLYIVMFIALIDAVLLGYRVRRKAVEKFGEGARKGAVMYVAMRVFQIRRTRLPKPQVKRGEFPS
ncbi:MAG TPA: DUF3043 domain-containing protein [Candidatus Ruania gallistercoris]|uniref:DUF3043 domain-containing protein n=1 Tax=Candidatus Ruania gallistercoris TaxID=2838746 RepID=A0A9D2J3R1_9MICO|nr:DUF3043 domain-containing protein [Candidatus Ruania gallistercoris]